MIETELQEVQRLMSQPENYSVEEKILKLVKEEERLRKNLADEEAAWLTLEEERMILEEELYE